MPDATEIDRAPFGHLRYGKEYGAEYWRGSIKLPGFEKVFSLIVRAGRGGPSQRQAAAMIAIVANASHLRQQATPAMAELHREAGLPVSDGEAEGKDVWSTLQPEEIEVSDESYYGDGRIFVGIIFGSTLEPDFAPAIETADGSFVQVLPGT
ncbi:hypothetical protein [Neorhizobium tomejilense]|uniref:hypothetical protein n=1 Tax=Neorhizobium tomejilense TaxID=2093828 RepID=UPI000CF8729B|nr:hypothetical protein [Neorhizobium tomejilense]